MALLTNDQYVGLNLLNRWYRKYQHQFIEIAGTIGTGVMDIINEFIEESGLDKREIMYLSYDQKQVLEMAFKGNHAYYINDILYSYIKFTDFNTIPILNSNSTHVEFKWKKKLRSKIDRKYKIVIVFDSTLMNIQSIQDLASFGLPVILIRDPMLLPSPNTYTFLRDANIELNEICEAYIKNPIVYFAHKAINGELFRYGNYDNVTVIPRKQLNLYNLKTSDMNITITDELRYAINDIYRTKILHRKDTINVVGEKVISETNLYNQPLVNNDNKKVKVHLVKGTIGYLTKVNKHVINTKYVGINFRPEFYHDEFIDLVMDRHHLNKIDFKSVQMIPDEPILFSYAYALTSALSRNSYWDKVTFIIDNNDNDVELQKRLIYTAITRARKSLNIIL